MPKEKIKFPSIKDVPASAWEKLAQKKIYFGHQSVGDNIMDGVNDLMKENPQIKINIVETNDPSNFSKPIFAHSSVGKNRSTQSKNEAFKRYIEEGLGKKVDFASYKYCFADIKMQHNAQKIYSEYKNAMSYLETKYPNVKFIHVTVPLLRKENVTIITWFKKKLLGKKDYFDNEHNVVRNDFNKFLKKEFGGGKYFFDLAKIESTFPDGKRETFEKDGIKYYSLIENYTNDGGHLNETGRKTVAEQLLVFLANLE